MQIGYKKRISIPDQWVTYAPAHIRQSEIVLSLLGLFNHFGTDVDSRYMTGNPGEFKGNQTGAASHIPDKIATSSPTHFTKGLN